MESQPRELKGKRQIEFNLATVGLILPFALYSSYAYYYYTYVIGLDALLSSIGLVIGLLTYAIGSPMLGVLSDNRPFRKNGKRRPFLIYGSSLNYYFRNCCLDSLLSNVPSIRASIGLWRCISG